MLDKTNQPFVYKGIPEPGEGVEVLSVKDAVALANDPEMRKAMDIAEAENKRNFPKEWNQGSAIKQAIRVQFKHHRAQQMQEDQNRAIIDSQLRRQK